jgi:tellurite resistance protein TerC
MWRSHGVEMEPDDNPLLKLMRRVLPIAEGNHETRFFTRQNGAFAVTPLFVVLVFVEWTDLVFAVDSIPAVLAVSRDSFVVFTSNVMAILGLRSLYFALAGVMERFHALHYGLAAILVFVGTKMCFADFFKIPTAVALGVVAGILTISVIVSMLRPPRSEAEETPKPIPHESVQ